MRWRSWDGWLMNVYSFIFWAIIEGEGPCVKAKVFSEERRIFPGRRRELLGGGNGGTACVRGEGLLSPFWLLR